MKEISLAKGDFKSKDALEILTAYVHAEISLYQRKMEVEEDPKKKEEYSAAIHRLQKILFEACEFIERKNGDVHLNSKLNIS